ncbi:MAG: hypothetical protein MMC33_000819 [Icmadophila ericetorum]|nr:hypothetical protein [Icmadophila ericetorum]
MEQRPIFVPMDFEYDNKLGSVDAKSPFLTNQMNRSTGQRGFSSTTFPGVGMQPPSTPTRGSIYSRKDSQTSPTKTLQPCAKDSFRHLRDTVDLDFSSGAENQSSPENADTENTPEVPRKGSPSKGSPTKLNSNITLFRGGASSPKRESISRFFARFSPGRGEISRKKNGDLVRRVHKRKRRELDRDTYKPSGSDSEPDENAKPSKSKDTVQQAPTGPSSVVSFFSFIESHPNLPHILSWYAQLVLNFSWIMFVIYIVYSFWSTIRQDVDMKAEEATAVILTEMTACSSQWVANKCEGPNRVPALETVCENWAKCMTRDPNAVGRAKVSAHTFAEIFNSFMEPISYKAMVFFLALTFGCIAVSNFAFGNFRNKHHPPPPTHYANPPPPQMHFPSGDPYFTPHRSRSGQMGMDLRLQDMERENSQKWIGY